MAESMERIVQKLSSGVSSWQATGLTEKARLLSSLRHRLGAEADGIVAAANTAQGCAQDQRWSGHQWWALYPVLGHVTAMEHVLTRLAAGRDPLPAHAIHTRDDGRVVVDVFPPGLADTALFAPWQYRAQAWMQTGVSADRIRLSTARAYTDGFPDAGVAVVLAAGNVPSLPLIDVLHVLYQRGCVAVVKLNEVNAYLLPHYERVFADFLERDWLHFVVGGADVGAYLVGHPGVDRLHMTGSAQTYDAIMWGTGEHARRNRAAGTPQLDKPFTCELGGVNPWIVVPGPWSHADVRHQADCIVGSKLFNCGHTCASPQVLVLPADWDRADDLLGEVRRLMADLPPNTPYYPGTDAKVARAVAGQGRAQFLQGVDRRALIELEPESVCTMFRDEVFADVLGVVRLPGSGVEAYLEAATEFANGQLAGDLSATLSIDPRTQRTHAPTLDRALGALRFGAIGVNEWAGLASGLGSTTWGGYPGNTASAVGSGIGVVGNAYMLQGVEKTVLTAAFRPIVKPLSAASHRGAAEVLRGVFHLRAEGDLRHVPSALVGTVRG